VYNTAISQVVQLDAIFTKICICLPSVVQNISGCYCTPETLFFWVDKRSKQNIDSL